MVFMSSGVKEIVGNKKAFQSKANRPLVDRCE